jgi:hypothetical protein
VPLAGFVPLHAPDAVQAVACVEVHVSSVDAPRATVVAPAESFTVATDITVTVASELTVAPAAPVQTNE